MLASIETKKEQVFDYELRAREDFVTWAAEALDGQMRTPTSYSYDAVSNELYADDASALGVIFEDALVHADELLRTHPQLAFEKRRRMHELDEYHEMLAMMRGEGPDTMIVVSDFPRELMSYPDDVGGYNVKRKQTFLRVIKRDGDTLQMYSQTLDGSNRAALESIYAYFGETAKPGELLGQRLRAETDATAEELTNELVAMYDETLAQNLGGAYYAGRQVTRVKENTYDFVLQQTDIVQHAVREVMRGTMSDDSMYNIAALLSERYKNQQFTPSKAAHDDLVDGLPASPGTYVGTVTMQHVMLTEALSSAGQAATASGKTFSGCGSSLGSKLSQEENSILKELGFGNKTSKEESYSFNAYRFCVSCQAPPKEKEKKKMCGPCGLCRGCDKKAGGKG